MHFNSGKIYLFVWEVPGAPVSHMGQINIPQPGGKRLLSVILRSYKIPYYGDGIHWAINYYSERMKSRRRTLEVFKIKMPKAQSFVLGVMLQLAVKSAQTTRGCVQPHSVIINIYKFQMGSDFKPWQYYVVTQSNLYTNCALTNIQSPLISDTVVKALLRESPKTKMSSVCQKCEPKNNSKLVKKA